MEETKSFVGRRQLPRYVGPYRSSQGFEIRRQPILSMSHCNSLMTDRLRGAGIESSTEESYVEPTAIPGDHHERRSRTCTSLRGQLHQEQPRSRAESARDQGHSCSGSFGGSAQGAQSAQPNSQVIWTNASSVALSGAFFRPAAGGGDLSSGGLFRHSIGRRRIHDGWLLHRKGGAGLRDRDGNAAGFCFYGGSLWTQRSRQVFSCARKRETTERLWLSRVRSSITMCVTCSAKEPSPPPLSVCATSTYMAPREQHKDRMASVIHHFSKADEGARQSSALRRIGWLRRWRAPGLYLRTRRSAAQSVFRASGRVRDSQARWTQSL